MNPGLHLHLGNRLERLADELAEVLREPGPPGLVPDTVVVQSGGMSRWLAQELATRLGLCANVRFPFPQTFVSSVFAQALTQNPTPHFDKSPLAWRIMRLLPDLLDDPAFAPVRAYLTGPQPDRKRHQLAAQLAALFDRYLAYRPHMILDWDAGNEADGGWQARLWRAVTAETGLDHQPGLSRRLAERLRDPAPLPAGLPARFSLFGISALPPFYTELLGELATRLEVHLFLLQPSPFLWTHLLSPRQEARLRRKGVRDPAALHYERGNALLASMGDLGRQFLDAVHGLDPATVSELFEPPDPATRLGRIQHDIYELDPGEPLQSMPPDDSLKIVACHSATREAEALYDELLARFEADPSLRPRDVLVMTPDLEGYAPVIEAVFGTPEDDSVGLPFSVADRTPRSASGPIDTFLRLLELAGSRLAVSTVMELLEAPAVRSRFELTETDLATIRRWLVATGIRWGLDAEHRRSFEVPAFSQNSWRAGLDRLLLGYALAGGDEQLFAGILPYDHIEGGDATTLGRFVDFTDCLFTSLDALAQARPLLDWQTLLRETVERFFAPDDDTAREMLALRRALEALSDLQRDAGFVEDVPLEILRDHLNAALSESTAGTGYLAGRVTFCALKPMRSLPFRFIALLGMNDASFPRSQPAPGFDLMTRQPRPGDRSSRDDDRYLFLETILSARDALYLSFVGQSPRDATALPPSVLVSELLDYAAQRFPGGQPVVPHRLQSFSPAYFSDNDSLFSYSRENADAARAAAGPRQDPAPFLPHPIAPPDAAWRSVSLETLIRFFAHPVRFFVTERLGLRLPADEPVLEDREPFAVGPLEGYHLKAHLLDHLLAGGTADDARPLTEAQGLLPAGAGAHLAYRRFGRAAEAMAKTVLLHATGEPLDPEPFARRFGDWNVSGTITHLRRNGLVSYRPAKLKAKDALALWIPLLALNCQRPTPGILIAEDRTLFFPPPDDSPQRLEELLALYGEGLREPLPLFPQSSLTFAESEQNGRKAPREDAARKWHDPSGRSNSECDDPYIDLVFERVEDPLDVRWESVARTVFGPFFAAASEDTP